MKAFLILFMFFILLFPAFAQEKAEIPEQADTSYQSEDEFSEFAPLEEAAVNAPLEKVPKNLPWTIGALLATVVAGVFMRFAKTRKLRGLFLVASVAILGFYVGGCPCPVSGLQHVILFASGAGESWLSMVWIIGLIPITYFFGKVWCGWVCHLGGLQEMIFKPGKLNFLKSERATDIMIWVRIFLLAALVIQVLITKTNLYKVIDPFKAIFNLYPANLVTWILLVLLLLSSIFVYRPFCRAVCPVGLVLGWISKIPGASILKTAESCNACKLCQQACETGAITRDEGVVKFNNEECIRCGQCLENCKKEAVKFGFRSSTLNAIPPKNPNS